MTHFDDPRHWHRRAEEARALADKMDDAQVRERMLVLAGRYEFLADRAVKRLKLGAIIRSAAVTE
jgi:hypothetical protein